MDLTKSSSNPNRIKSEEIAPVLLDGKHKAVLWVRDVPKFWR